MNHNFTDLEYFISKDRIVYLVKGYYHTKEGVFACPAFWPDQNGKRVHPLWGKYTKDVSDFNKKIFILHPEYRHKFIPSTFPLVLKRDIVNVFNPREKIKQFQEKEKDTIWFKILEYLTERIGVNSNDIGIFGSYLVDLNRDKEGKAIKDVDFVIYGIDNFHKIRLGIEKLLKYFSFTHISSDHIRYHQEKFGKLFDPTVNSFDKTLSNKWSSIQVKPGLLSTLRFVYKEDEIPPNPITTEIEVPLQVEGVVEEDIGVNFVPRVFTVRAIEKLYTVVTYFWAFQSCVKKGDKVRITGNLHKDRKTISIDSSSHGIKILS